MTGLLKTYSDFIFNNRDPFRQKHCFALKSLLFIILVSFSYPIIIIDTLKQFAPIYAFALTFAVISAHFGTLSSLKTVPENFFRTMTHLLQGRILIQIHLSGVAECVEAKKVKKIKTESKRGILSAIRPFALFYLPPAGGEIIPTGFFT
jgi:hypothetical protein